MVTRVSSHTMIILAFNTPILNFRLLNNCPKVVKENISKFAVFEEP